jgi:hypothetical protein
MFTNPQWVRHWITGGVCIRCGFVSSYEGDVSHVPANGPDAEMWFTNPLPHATDCHKEVL